MPESPNRILLVGYLEEALPAEKMTRIEKKLRDSDAWRQALVDLLGELDLGEHSVATIWRRHRLTCPSRETWGAFLLETLAPLEQDYLRFHLEVIGCRRCEANVCDLKSSRGPAANTETSARRRRLFNSSVGGLR